MPLFLAGKPAMTPAAHHHGGTLLQKLSVVLGLLAIGRHRHEVDFFVRLAVAVVIDVIHGDGEGNGRRAAGTCTPIPRP